MFSDKEKAFAVEHYLKTGSFKKAALKFRQHYKTRHSPSKQRIYEWTDKFRKTGSVKKQNLGKSGRARKARSKENVAILAASVEDDGEISIRRRLFATAVPVSLTSAWRILRKDLSLFPYTISMRHKLTDRDCVRRQEMCEVFLQRIRTDPGWLDNVWFSDESHFHLSGKVNKTHCVFWGKSKPDKVLQQPLHSKKVTVWAAFSSHGIIGPYFFEDDTGNALSVNSERYVEVLQKFLTELRRRVGNTENHWLMQDGASSHVSRFSLQWIAQNFPGRVISLKTGFPWAPYSPDLNPLDYFVWGHLKDTVYRGAPLTIEELKLSIYQNIAKVNDDKELCQRVLEIFKKRVTTCSERNGRHLEHIL